MMEMLIASVLFLIVFALAMGLYTDAFRNFVKGDDTLTSARDASLVMMALRRDVVGMARGPATSAVYDVRLVNMGPGGNRTTDIKLEPASGTAVVTRRPGAQSMGGHTQPHTQLCFFIRPSISGGIEDVTYTYFPGTFRLERRVGNTISMSYGDERLRDFELDVCIQPILTSLPPGVSATAGGLSASSVATTAPIPITQFWVRTKFRAQSDEDAVPMRSTSVDLESRIVPKHLNKAIHALWDEQ